jgi:hypothetical protein
VKTPLTYRVFGHLKAADDKVVNSPLQNLTNAVSPFPANQEAGSRSYGKRSRSSVQVE